MNYWFECKVGYDKTTETGMVKKVTEVYLVDALSFTEAEERIIKEVSIYCSMGELDVLNIKRVKISEMFLNEDDKADRYYRARVLFITFDEKSGVEKKSPANFIVKVANLPDAVSEIVAQMDKQMGDYEIYSISDTSILDVFRYEPKN